MPAIGPPRPLRRQKPSRRRPHRYIKTRRRNIGWRLRILLASGLCVATIVLWAVIARGTAPASNTTLTRFDAIIVLGIHADSDGNPTPEMLSRVTEAVHEYERGVAPHIVFTGAAVHNRFVEAEVMARTAEAEGIPASAIAVEPSARDTIQNACYSTRILERRGWRSAEVVTSGYHVPRAGLIFSHMPIEWRTHAAPFPGSGIDDLLEILKTARYVIYARHTESCEL